MKPGIQIITNSAYHKGPGLSSTGIKNILKSPMHFKEASLNPVEPTTEMLRGTLIHTLLLEPEKFEEDYVVGDFSVRRGKEYEKLLTDNPTKTIITRAEYEESEKIREAFNFQMNTNKDLAALMEGTKELSFYWEDEKTGVKCKVRPDNITPGGVIVDLKTTWNASYDQFQKQMVDLGYWISAAYYLKGVRETFKQTKKPDILPVCHTFKIVAVETKAPYPVAIYEIGPKALDEGAKYCDRALEIFADCIATDEWPGYAKQALVLELPNWFFYKQSYTGIK